MRDATVDDDEGQRVVVWQLRRFVDLGFTLDQARLLVAADADWHLAERMLAQGCSVDRAFAILI